MTDTPLPPADQPLTARPDLASKSARSGAATAVAQVLTLGVQLSATPVLARLLEPSDFGLVAMVTSLSFLLNMFRELGIQAAVVQRERVSGAELNAVTAWSVLAGIATGLLFLILAPVLALAYREPRLIEIAVALGALSAVSSLATVPLALLMRRMAFRAIAIRSVLAAVCGAAAAIIAAAMGAGYWALVLQTAAGMLVSLVLVWTASGFRPGWSGFRPGLSLMKFGVNLGAAKLLQGSVRNLDNVVIGLRSGEAALGQYALAYRVLLLPISQINTPLTQVAIPTLSRLQNEHRRYRKFYRHALLLATSAGTPVVVALTLVADLFIPLYLGPGWERAVVLFWLLSPAAFIGTTNFATGWAFVSCGQAGRQLQWTLISAPLVVLSFVIGSIGGPEGVAAAYSGTVFVMRWFGLAFCFKYTIPTYRDFLQSVWRPSAAALLPLIALGLARLAIVPDGIDPILELAASLAAFGLLYALLWRTLPGGRGAFDAVVRTGEMLLPARFKPATGEGSDKP